MAHERISERVRDIGDGLILAFPITQVNIAGDEIDTVRLYFFRVGSETRYFQRYTSLSAINSGSTTPSSGYGFLGDSGVDSGSDIFRQATDDWHVQHFAVGTNHPDLQVFYAVSPNANGNPAQDRQGDGEDITPGTDDRGWFAQSQIPDRLDPPAFTERVAFRNSESGEFLRWAFFNDGSNQLSGGELELYFTGRAYELQPVTHQPTQDLMLQMAMTRPQDPVIDTIIHQVGGVNTYTLGTEEPDSWKEVRKSDNPLTREFKVGEIQSGAPISEPPGMGSR